MKLSIRATTLTMALLGAASMLLVGIVNMIMPIYGGNFLQMMSSVYPGFHDSRTWLSILIGTVYGLIDGAVAGWIFARVYDWIVGVTEVVDHTA